MKAVMQRVKHAMVRVDGAVVGQIEQGLLVLLGVGQGDTATEAAYVAKKIAAMRLFSDGQKMNLSLQDVGGAVLCVSQFTLYADTKKGNRPSFLQAAAPASALELYGLVCQQLRQAGLKVEQGVFGADMQVLLENDGPVTICLDTDINLGQNAL